MEKEIIEDITKEVADGKLVSADAALKSTQKDHRSAAKDEHKKNLYNTAKRGERKPREEAAAGEIQSKMVCVNRITKVVKGGRTLRFNAVVIIGDKNGRVAVGSGKAREVSEAIKKAEADGKKNLVRVVLVGNTIPHEVTGQFGTSKVKIIPTKEGSGIIAGGSVRSVLELAGYKDVTAKCFGSTTATNVVKATMDALMGLRTREEVSALRGKEI